MNARVLKRYCAIALTAVKLRGRTEGRRVALSARVGGDVRIGAYTYIGARSELMAAVSGIQVGRYCSIGRDVKIFSAAQAHRFDGISSYPFFELNPSLNRLDFNPPLRDTVIGNDVWIGSGAMIMPGTVVGDGAVIGAGSIVTKDVTRFDIVAGVPARVIGKRFSASVCELVGQSQWWQYDWDELQVVYGEYVTKNRSIAGGFFPSDSN